MTPGEREWLRLILYRGFSQAFYRERLYETDLGFKDLEDFMQNFWEKWALSKGEFVGYRYVYVSSG